MVNITASSIWYLLGSCQTAGYNGIVFPVIFSIGSISISTIGVTAVLAWFTGTFLFWRRAKEEGVEAEKIFDLAFLGVMGGLLFGRLVFILESWPLFIPDWRRSLNLLNYGGFSLTPYLVWTLVVLWFLSKKYKWRFWSIAELVLLSYLPAHIIIRFGQFLEGSYSGIKTNLLPILSGSDGFYLPIQLFDALIMGILFFWFKRLEKQYRLFTWYQNKRGEAEPGFLVLAFICLYGLWRFLLAFIQSGNVYWLGFQPAHLVAVIAVVMGVVGFLAKTGRLEQYRLNLASVKKLEAIKEKTEQIIIRQPVLRHRSSIKGNKPHIKAGRDAKL